MSSAADPQQPQQESWLRRQFVRLVDYLQCDRFIRKSDLVESEELTHETFDCQLQDVAKQRQGKSQDELQNVNSSIVWFSKQSLYDLICCKDDYEQEENDFGSETSKHAALRQDTIVEDHEVKNEKHLALDLDEKKHNPVIPEEPIIFNPVAKNKSDLHAQMGQGVSSNFNISNEQTNILNHLGDTAGTTKVDVKRKDKQPRVRVPIEERTNTGLVVRPLEHSSQEQTSPFLFNEDGKEAHENQKQRPVQFKPAPLEDTESIAYPQTMVSVNAPLPAQPPRGIQSEIEKMNEFPSDIIVFKVDEGEVNRLERKRKYRVTNEPTVVIQEPDNQEISTVKVAEPKEELFDNPRRNKKRKYRRQAVHDEVEIE